MLVVQGITDLLDGFQLEPKPQAVRALTIGTLVLAVADIASVLFLVVLSAIFRQPLMLLAAAAILLVGVAMQLLMRRVLRPPILKADSVSVTYNSGFKTVVVPRTDLTMIFKGQVVQKGRYTAWVQSYVFGVANGKVMFAAPAFWFRPEDVATFAERLGVPVRGDFTQRVTGTISEQR